MTRIGLLDSGLGLLGTADALFHLAPHADLVLAMDPDFTPYGSLSPEALEARALNSAAVLAEWDPDAIVIACNTASVQALEAVRARYEPDIPVIGTVPAVKMAAGTGQDFAIWATPATTGSAYQQNLIDTFASEVTVSKVACPGLAEAINEADSAHHRRRNRRRTEPDGSRHGDHRARMHPLRPGRRTDHGRPGRGDHALRLPDSGGEADSAQNRRRSSRREPESARYRRGHRHLCLGAAHQSAAVPCRLPRRQAPAGSGTGNSTDALRRSRLFCRTAELFAPSLSHAQESDRYFRRGGSFLPMQA